MKKRLLAIIVAVLLAFSMATVGFAAEKETQITVVVSDNASVQTRYAAEALQKYLGAKNAEVEVEDEKEDGEYNIVLAESDADKNSPDGSYLIKEIDGGVKITGAGNRGVLYGAYAFLEKFAGYRCFTSAEGMMSLTDGLTLPDKVDIEYKPTFEYTDTDWRSPRDSEYSVMNGLSGGVYRDIPSEMGGDVNYLGSFCHTLTTLFCSADTYFDQHPEYFALHGGKRDPQQLCLTSDEVYELVLGEVLALLKEQHDPDAALQIVSLTQNDSGEDGAFCECEKCAAIDSENGSHAGTMITFVNRIADAIKAEGYDNVAIDTFAYRYTRTAPSKVIPRDNVIVRLCTIECCFSHPLDEESCAQNVKFMDDLKKWSEICDRLYIWDYTTNYAYTLGIFPDFGVLQKNAQIFRDHSVKGVYEEGNYYIDSCDSEFGELRAYLISQVLKDPDCDYSGCMNEFLKAYYGAGWKNIREFLDMTSENAAKNDVEIYTPMKETLTFSEDEVAKGDELWSKALEECETDVQREHLQRSLLSWRYWKASAGMGEYKGLFRAANEKKTLYNDLLSFGIVNHSEGNSPMEEINFGYPYMSADDWFGGNESPFVTILYVLSWVIYAGVLVLALLIFIRAIKLKKVLFLVLLPLLAAASELFLWNRRAYLAWRDLDEYVISLIIACAVFMFVFALAGKAKGKKTSACVLSAFKGLPAFIIPYEASLLIINNLIYGGRANNFAYSVSMVLCSACMLTVTAVIRKALRKIR